MSGRARLWAVFVAAGLVVSALLVPMRLVLGTFAAGTPLVARDVSGSLWAGRLRGARWGGLPLDTVALRLRPAPLLYGQQHWTLANDRLRATLVRGRVSGLRDANGELDLASPAWPGATIRLGLEDTTLLFRDRRCDVAEGRLGLDLQLPAGGPDDAAPPALRLDGRPACAGADARIEFAPAGSLPPGIASVAIHVDIHPAGDYGIRTTVDTAIPEIRAGFRARGFEEDATGLVRVDRGRLLP